MARICRAFTLGDWFLLYQLGKNIDPIIFRFRRWLPISIIVLADEMFKLIMNPAWTIFTSGSSWITCTKRFVGRMRKRMLKRLTDPVIRYNMDPIHIKWSKTTKKLCLCHCLFREKTLYTLQVALNQCLVDICEITTATPIQIKIYELLAVILLTLDNTK